MSTELKETLQNIGSELKSYQDKNDERIEAIEKGDKARAEELMEELKKRDEALEKLHDRYDELEVKMKRVNTPNGDGEKQDYHENEIKALDSFVRYDKDSEMSLGDYSDRIKLDKTPEEIKDIISEEYSHKVGFDIKDLPDNLKSLGRSIKKKAMSTDSLADGGVFSLPNFSMELIKGIREQSPVRQVARVIPIGSGDSWHGTVRDTTIASQNAGERENVSDTDTPTYKAVRIQTHERAASPALTRQQIEDSFLDIVSEIQRDGQEEFAVQEGAQFISGDGVSEAEGILTNSDVGETTFAASSFDVAAAGTSDIDAFNAIIDLQTSLKQGYNGTWMFSRQTRGHIRKFKDGNDNYIWSPNVAAEAPNTILGDPYLLATDLASPSSGSYSSNDVPFLYGDFMRGYYIIDRLGLDVLRDPYSNRPFIEIYMRRRYGGQVVLPEAIKKLRLT